MNFCKYSNQFGMPGQGIHSYRLFDIAIVDVIMTILVGLLISYVFKYNIIYVLIVLFLIGIIVHKIFCVDTALNNMIFSHK